MTKKEAEQKLLELRRDMFEVQSAQRKSREIESAKRRYLELAREIEAAVKAEKISKEEAKKKLIELERKMKGDK